MAKEGLEFSLLIRPPDVLAVVHLDAERVGVSRAASIRNRPRGLPPILCCATDGAIRILLSVQSALGPVHAYTGDVMRIPSAILTAMLLAATPSLAEPATCLHLINAGLPPSQNCKKGCRYGNACISCSKTCRVGSAPPPVQTSTRRTPSPVSDAQRTLNSLTDLPPVRPDTEGWMASVRNKLFFRPGCALVPVLLDEDRVKNPDTLLFKKLGFRRLVVPGC